ncbi:MAG TPA: O-antigen ligase family protein [Sphingomicrobium sp.]|nr:O-antigen ligase family protein [Sphingomicrobium sp.]
MTNEIPTGGRARTRSAHWRVRDLWSDKPFAVAAAFFIVAFALGGAGTHYPLLEMVVELTALVVLFYFAAVYRWGRPDRTAALGLFALLLVCLLPLAQLVPLPPELWQGLPGRERPQQVLRLIGADQSWMPLTLDREASWRSFLALLPGVAAFVAGLALGERNRLRLVFVILSFAALSALLGALQIAFGASAALYESGHSGLATGLFTNRNHQAVFLNLAIILSGAMGGLDRSAGLRRPIAIALILLFAAAALATKSRTGAALLVIAVPIALLMLARARLKPAQALMIAGAGVLALGALLFTTTAGEVVLGRFDSADDPRFSYWKDVWAAIAQYWPAGSGFGTFAVVYQSFEPLSSVSPAFVNHAHNDYLELLLEGGLPALVVAGLAVGALSVAAWRSIREPEQGGQRSLAAAGALGLLVLLAHSLVDYPMRMLSLIALFGFLAALLFNPAAAWAKGR